MHENAQWLPLTFIFHGILASAGFLTLPFKSGSVSRAAGLPLGSGTGPAARIEVGRSRKWFADHDPCWKRFEVQRAIALPKVFAKECAELMAKPQIDADSFQGSDLRMYDLRSTLGNWQAKKGASLYRHRKQLGPSQPSGNGDLRAARPGSGARICVSRNFGDS